MYCFRSVGRHCARCRRSLGEESRQNQALMYRRPGNELIPQEHGPLASTTKWRIGLSLNQKHMRMLMGFQTCNRQSRQAWKAQHTTHAANYEINAARPIRDGIQHPRGCRSKQACGSISRIANRGTYGNVCKRRCHMPQHRQQVVIKKHGGNTQKTSHNPREL